MDIEYKEKFLEAFREKRDFKQRINYLKIIELLSKNTKKKERKKGKCLQKPEGKNDCNLQFYIQPNYQSNFTVE